MQNKYLALLHKIWFTHKNLFEIFSMKNLDFKLFYENLSFENLKKYKISENKILQILGNKKNLDEKNIFEKIDKLQVKIITFFDDDYPENLKNIFNPPFLIYVRWDLSWNFLAFVWSRDISSYWKKIIEKFTPEVWKYFWIISWWAAWCDAYSHKISLENNIKTIAIFWTWIDVFYPEFNKNLFEEILKKWWALVSCFPIWEPGNKYNFPIRNEIVAWWSKWVFIVEAKHKSWSLITANLALDLWKDLFTSPWDIFRQNSTWCNELLLKWEAKMVLTSKDILSEFNINPKNIEKNKEIIFNDDLEKDIYNILLNEPLNIDQISSKLQIDISTSSLKISFMELSMLIKKWDNWKYEII